MTTRERYYHLRHLERLLLWQIAQVEREIIRARNERRERMRRMREAYRNVKFGISAVRRANVAYYNRAIARGF